jgi:hypothetical protein
MSEGFSRRGLFGALAAGLLTLVGRKPATAALAPAPAPVPPAPRPYVAPSLMYVPGLSGSVTTFTYDACGKGV